MTYADGSVTERVRAVVDESAVEHNCRRLRSELSQSAAFCAVVKADGYGHGAARCAHAAKRAGADWLAVVSAQEALALRRSEVPGPLLVMGALTGPELKQAAEARADVVAWTPEFVAAAAALARSTGDQVRVHVKVDSGMGRLGIKDPGEAGELAALVAGTPELALAGVMTHFATADEVGDSYFPYQLGRFTDLVNRLKARHPGLLAHAANSAATLRDPRAHFDMVRCGVAIYGLDPFQQDPAARGLRPALTLQSYVASVKRFEPWESAGYGRRWVADQPTYVGVLPIGYGDGWRRALTNNGDVLLRGRRHPLIGTVSMDNVTVDLGPDTDVQLGEPAVLIGAQGEERILAEEVAARLGTINYEVTCGLTQRVPRYSVPGENLGTP